MMTTNHCTKFVLLLGSLQLETRVLSLEQEIKHFEIKVSIKQSGIFEDEVGPGVLQLSVQQIYTLSECQGTKLRPLRVFLFCPDCLAFLQKACLLMAGLEHFRPGFQVQPNFRKT